MKKAQRNALARVGVIIVVVPLILGFLGWLYYGDLRSKSVYYRLNDSDVLRLIVESELSWDDQNLEFYLPRMELQISSSDFDKKNFRKSHLDLHYKNLDSLSSQVPFDSLSDKLKQVLNKVPELGLRKVESNAAGLLEIQIGIKRKLYYAENADLLRDLKLNGTALDDHWLSLRVDDE